MSLFDETVRLSGRPATIIRTPLSLATFIVDDMYGKTSKEQLNPYRDYEFVFRFRADSGITYGEMVTIGVDYYLAMAIKEEWLFGNLEYFKVKLFKCNSLVSIYYFNTTTKRFDTLHGSGVHCLITTDSGNMSYDQGLAVKGYAGKGNPLQIYMRSSEGLSSDCVLVDQANRRYKVSKNFDIYVTDNVAQTNISLEI